MSPSAGGTRRELPAALAADTLFDARYRIVHVLGQGGCGTVYRVRDEHAPAGAGDLALKTLHAGGLNAVASRGFEIEFSLLARLRHPHLVRVDRFATAPGGVRYFVGELVPGPDLRRAARLGGPAVLLYLAGPILRALGHIHRHGYVHQDVKPGNVLVAGAEDAPPAAWVPKLTDLGIASATGADPGGTVTGTVQYLSPERLAGAPADPLGDLWALGMTLYACAAGKPPVPTKVEEAARWLRTHAVPPLRDVCPEAPSALERLIVGLCALDIRNRVRSADEALETLERLLAGQTDPGAPAAPRQDAGAAAPRAESGAAIAARVHNAPLVGCGDVVAAGTAVLAARRRPAARTLLLRGPPGSGRTRVLGEIGVRAQLAGARLVEVESGAGRRPWEAALRQLGVPRATYVSSVEGIAAALLRALAAVPAVLVCEDLGQRDGLATHVILRLAAALSMRPLDHPGGLLVSCDAGGLPAMPDAPAAAVDPAGVVQRALDPLTAPDVAALVAAALAGAPPPAIAERVLRESGGNPGAATGALRALLEGSAVRRVGSSWVMDAADADETLRAGRGDRRLDALDPVAARLLEALALFGPAGVTVPLETAEAAAALAEPDLLAALEPLCASGLVRLHVGRAAGGGAAVAHTSEAIRAQCAERVEPAVRRAVHERALAAMRAAGEEDPAALGGHALGAGRAEEALALALRAAEQALARHDGLSALAAADLAVQAATGVASAPAFRRLAQRLRARALLLLGRLGEAGALATRVCEEDPSDAAVALVRAEVAVVIGDAAAIGPALAHARALLAADAGASADAADDDGDSDGDGDGERRAVQADFAALEVEAALLTGPPKAALAAGERALAAVPPFRTLERARVHQVVGEAAVRLGDMARGRAEFETALRLREAHGDDRAIADAYTRLAMHADLSGEQDAAQRYVTTGLVHAERAGAQAAMARLLNVQGIISMWSGRTHDAAAAFVEAERRGHLSGFDRVVSSATGNRVVVHYQEGLIGQSLAAAARSLAVKRRLGDRVGIVTTWTNLAVAYLWIDEARVAMGLSRRIVATAERLGMPTMVANGLLTHAWALRLLGQPVESLATLDRLGRAGVPRLASARNEGDAAVIRGATLIALGQHAAALESLDRIPTIPHEGAHAFKLAWMHLVRAEALGDLGEDDLRRAIDVSLHAGALAAEWEARARLGALLRARGESEAASRELVRAAAALRAMLADMPARLRHRYRSRSRCAPLVALVAAAERADRRAAELAAVAAAAQARADLPGGPRDPAWGAPPSGDDSAPTTLAPLSRLGPSTGLSVAAELSAFTGAELSGPDVPTTFSSRPPPQAREATPSAGAEADPDPDLNAEDAADER
ncbi:MAG TPA: protein kinase [Myxococcota bacterium]|nr:protein kinase [Myxococcota bacterium]